MRISTDEINGRLEFLSMENSMDGHNYAEFCKMDKSHLKQTKINAFTKAVQGYSKAFASNVKLYKKAKEKKEWQTS